jgi:hypothetical protein
MKGPSVVEEAVEHLVRLLPARTALFEGSEYPVPVAQTFLGDGPVDLARIRRSLVERADDDSKAILTPLLIAAEQCEAASADKGKYFLDDSTVRSLVFMGSKWRAGWALVLGGNGHERTVELLKGADFMVFTDHAGIADTQYIGDRPTSPIYFLQLMVRYGLIWGGIAPGDDHRMGHFLEEDMPGLLAITEELPPLQYLIVLGITKMGHPRSCRRTSPSRTEHARQRRRRNRSCSRGATSPTFANGTFATRSWSCRPSAIPRGRRRSSSRGRCGAETASPTSRCAPRWTLENGSPFADGPAGAWVCS